MSEDETFALLEQVKDQESFVRFVVALAEERRAAAEDEKAQPQRHMIDGARGWSNADIASFLEAGLAYFGGGVFHKPEKEPSWRMFADFLWFGKIYE